MLIFYVAKIFCIFCIFAFLSGGAFLSMLSEPIFALESAIKRACGRSCLLAPEGLLKALSRLFTKPGGQKKYESIGTSFFWNVKFF